MKVAFRDHRLAGWALGACIAAMSINASLYRKLPYDPRRDLTPVSVLATATYILVTHPSLPVNSLPQLVALAKARPRDLNYGSGGAGTGPQVAMELMKLTTGINITHVPYKGQGAALIDLISGQVQVGMINMIGTLQVVQSGLLRAMAVTGAKRSSALPAIPTMEESGIAGFREIAGHMVMVPSGTPVDIVARLNREIVRAVRTPEVKSRLENEGAEVIGSTPEQAAAIVRRPRQVGGGHPQDRDDGELTDRAGRAGVGAIAKDGCQADRTPCLESRHGRSTY
jgi:tripartite-type tricarboxylate transporter receptor subunit TctC